MLNDLQEVEELLRKAEQACFDYKAVFGKFPERIGIRSDYPFPLPPSIVITELNPVPLQLAVQELKDEPVEYATYTRHAIWLEPIAGPGIKPDEVYLPLPESKWLADMKQRAFSSAVLAKMAMNLCLERRL